VGRDTVLEAIALALRRLEARLACPWPWLSSKKTLTYDAGHEIFIILLFGLTAVTKAGIRSEVRQVCCPAGQKSDTLNEPMPNHAKAMQFCLQYCNSIA